jgi:putative oxidoreductase
VVGTARTGYASEMILRKVARPLLASIFVTGGINALLEAEQHGKVAQPFLDRTVGKAADVLPDAVPTDPTSMVTLDALVKIAGGLALGLGKLPRLAALGLIASLVPTTFAGHPFWEIEDPKQRAMQRTQFFKNLGLLGGLLLASADTEGKPSLGWRTRRAAARLGDRAHELMPS